MSKTLSLLNMALTAVLLIVVLASKSTQTVSAQASPPLPPIFKVGQHVSAIGGQSGTVVEVTSGGWLLIDNYGLGQYWVYPAPDPRGYQLR